MHRCYFDTVEQAVAHARQHGGWIAVGNDGSVQWFDASRWTYTPIIKLVANHHDGGTIGTWPLFDPSHACHEVLA